MVLYPTSTKKRFSEGRSTDEPSEVLIPVHLLPWFPDPDKDENGIISAGEK